MAKRQHKLIDRVIARLRWLAYKWLYDRLDSKQKTKALLMINRNKGKKKDK